MSFAERWLRRTLFHADLPGEALSPARLRSLELETELEALDAFGIPSVVAGRQLIADTAAMMPMSAVNADGRVDETPSILRRPDPNEPYRRTIERIVNQLTRHGMAVLRVTAYGSNGYPLALEVIDWNRCTANLDRTNTRIVSFNIDGIQCGREVTYIPMLVDDGPVGESPLRKIDAALAQLVEVYRFTSQFYGSAAAPPYAVVHPNRLTRDQADLLSAQWLEARAERRPAVLSGNITLEQYSPMSAADAMATEATEYLDASVARVLGIPPSLINTPAQSSLTYSTTVGEFRRWLTLGLYPQYLARIESVFSDLVPRGTYARFDTANLTRLDLEARIAAYGEAQAIGIQQLPEIADLFEGTSENDVPPVREIA